MNKVTKDIFVCFYTGFIEEEGYGTKKYFTEHPQLSNELLEALLQKNVSETSKEIFTKCFQSPIWNQ